MRNKEGFDCGLNRVYRLYCALGLNRRLPRGKKQPKPPEPKPVSVADYLRHTVSMDIAWDQKADGSPVRVLFGLDDFSRKLLVHLSEYSLPAEYVVRGLDQAFEKEGYPERIRTDNGPEFTNKVFKAWAASRGIELIRIERGKPQQNGLAERVIGTARREHLSRHEFDTLEQIQESGTSWVYEYNNVRPHMALGHLTPMDIERRHWASKAARK